MSRAEKRDFSNLAISTSISMTPKQILVRSCEARYLFVQTFNFLQTLEFKMASVFGVVTPLVVEIKNRFWPFFMKHPFKSIEDDSEGAFSFVPYDVLHNKDIRAYIYYNLEELGNVDKLDLYNKHLADGLGNLKPEYKVLQEKNFSHLMHFPLFDEVEWIWYIIS